MNNSDLPGGAPLITWKWNRVKTYGDHDDEDFRPKLNSTKRVNDNSGSILIVYTTRLDEMRIFKQRNMPPDLIIKSAECESKPNFLRLPNTFIDKYVDHRIKSYAIFKNTLDAIFNKKEKHSNRLKTRSAKKIKPALHQIKPASDFVSNVKEITVKPANSKISTPISILNNGNSIEMNKEQLKMYVFKDVKNHMVQIYNFNTNNDLHDLLGSYYELSDIRYKTMLRQKLVKLNIGLVEKEYCCWVNLKQTIKDMGDQYNCLLEQARRKYEDLPNKCDCSETKTTTRNSPDRCYIYLHNNLKKLVEFYEISIKSKAMLKYITCTMDDQIQVAMIENKLRDNTESKTVIAKNICCWYNQKQVLGELRLQIPHSIVNFIKKKHECPLDCCVCCCYKTKTKSKRTKSFDFHLSKDFTYSRNFSLSEKLTESVICVENKKLNSCNKPSDSLRKIKNQQNHFSLIMNHILKVDLSSYPDLSIEFNLFELILKYPVFFFSKSAISFENDMQEVQDCIVKILNVFQEISLTVELNGKISANLKIPITNYPTSSLKILALVISCAQMQIEEYKLISKLLTKNGLEMPHVQETQQITDKTLIYSFNYKKLPICNINNVSLRSLGNWMRKKKPLFQRSYNSYQNKRNNKDNISDDVASNLPIIENTFSLKDLDIKAPVLKNTTDNWILNQSNEKVKSKLQCFTEMENPGLGESRLFHLLSKPADMNKLKTFYSESQKRILSNYPNELATKKVKRTPQDELKSNNNLVTIDLTYSSTTEIETNKTKIDNTEYQNTLPIASTTELDLNPTEMVSYLPTPKASPIVTPKYKFIYNQKVPSTSNRLSVAPSTNMSSNKTGANTKQPTNLSKKGGTNTPNNLNNIGSKVFVASKTLLANINLLEDDEIKDEHCVSDDDETT